MLSTMLKRDMHMHSSHPLIPDPALSGFRAEHSALPFASVVQTTTLLLVSIRQENPVLVDRVSTTTRLQPRTYDPTNRSHTDDGGSPEKLLETTRPVIRQSPSPPRGGCYGAGAYSQP